jgi:hypothetical protein
MQSQNGRHRYRVRFGVTFVHEMQGTNGHQEGTGPEEEQEEECHCRQVYVWLGGDETRRCGGLGAFFAFAAASVLVLLPGCRGRRQRGCRSLRLLGGWRWGGRGSCGRCFSPTLRVFSCFFYFCLFAFTVLVVVLPAARAGPCLRLLEVAGPLFVRGDDSPGGLGAAAAATDGFQSTGGVHYAEKCS